jgi:hypothetical protein
MRSFATTAAALVCFISSASGSSDVAPPTVVDESCGRVVVRAHFDDPAMLREVMWWTDPWELDPVQGVLVVDADTEGLDRLIAAGFRLEVDPELTRALCVRRPASAGQQSGIPGFAC